VNDPAETAPAAKPLLLNARRAAAALSISPRLLWQLTKDGQVPHVRIARRVLYDPADLRAWIEARKVKEST